MQPNLVRKYPPRTGNTIRLNACCNSIGLKGRFADNNIYCLPGATPVYTHSLYAVPAWTQTHIQNVPSSIYLHIHTNTLSLINPIPTPSLVQLYRLPPLNMSAKLGNGLLQVLTRVNQNTVAPLATLQTTNHYKSSINIQRPSTQMYITNT